MGRRRNQSSPFYFISLCFKWAAHHLLFVVALRFDLKFEGYGVDVEEYKAPTPTRKFRAWIEDWELPLLKKNEVIAEVRLIEKYKGLVLYDPDNECMYTVYPKNLKWTRGQGGGWSLICQPAGR